MSFCKSFFVKKYKKNKKVRKFAKMAFENIKFGKYYFL